MEEVSNRAAGKTSSAKGTKGKTSCCRRFSLYSLSIHF
jgi:hypothetical protein